MAKPITTNFSGPILSGTVQQTTSTGLGETGRVKNEGWVLNTQVSEKIFYNSGLDFDTGIIIPQYSNIVDARYLVETAFTNSSTTAVTLGGMILGSTNTISDTNVGTSVAIGATAYGPLAISQVGEDTFYGTGAESLSEGDIRLYVGVTANSATAGRVRLYVSYVQQYFQEDDQ
jgi:hypothetical protein|tara:strand:- start:57 stop:578 length:522 start_codon:yes stop_codon:yes gene_type:complete